MAGKTMYQLAVSAMLGLDNELLSLEDLKQLIRKHLASKETGIKSYLKVMAEGGLTKEEEPFKFRIKLT